MGKYDELCKLRQDILTYQIPNDVKERLQALVTEDIAEIMKHEMEVLEYFLYNYLLLTYANLKNPRQAAFTADVDHAVMIDTYIDSPTLLVDLKPKLPEVYRET